MALGEEDKEDKAVIWGIYGSKKHNGYSVPLGEAFKASLTRHCGPTVPLGAETEEAVQLGLFFPLGLIWPSRPGQHATFEFEWVYSESRVSSVPHQQRVSRARHRQGVGSTLAN